MKPLNMLPLQQKAFIHSVVDASSADPIATRLRDLGFVHGEPVTLVAHSPFGGDPLLVQIGFTRFALRKTEAARIMVEELVHV